jgi:hypothetical protein
MAWIATFVVLMALARASGEEEPEGSAAA